jgi:hypothetical protein
MTRKKSKLARFKPLTKKWLLQEPTLEGAVTKLNPPLVITSSMLMSDGRLDEICIVQPEADTDEDNS